MRRCSQLTLAVAALLAGPSAAASQAPGAVTTPPPAVAFVATRTVAVRAGIAPAVDPGPPRVDSVATGSGAIRRLEHAAIGGGIGALAGAAVGFGVGAVADIRDARNGGDSMVPARLLLGFYGTVIGLVSGTLVGAAVR